MNQDVIISNTRVITENALKYELNAGKIGGNVRITLTYLIITLWFTVRLWMMSFSIVIKYNIAGKRPSTGPANTVFEKLPPSRHLM